MNLKKAVTNGIFAVSLLAFSGVASANAFDAVENLLPIGSKMTVSYKDDAGKKCFEHYATIFEAKDGSDSLNVRLVEVDGKKTATLDVVSVGYGRFYDYISIKSGSKSIVLQPKNLHKMSRRMINGQMNEFLMFIPTEEEWQFIKKADSLRAEMILILL